jgi:hypothetical protein
VNDSTPLMQALIAESMKPGLPPYVPEPPKIQFDAELIKRVQRMKPDTRKNRWGHWKALAIEVLAGREKVFLADRKRKNENSLRAAMKNLGYAPIIRNYGKTFEVQGWRKRRVSPGKQEQA